MQALERQKGTEHEQQHTPHRAVLASDWNQLSEGCTLQNVEHQLLCALIRLGRPRKGLLFRESKVGPKLQSTIAASN